MAGRERRSRALSSQEACPFRTEPLRSVTAGRHSRGGSGLCKWQLVESQGAQPMLLRVGSA